jgi:iron complex outermembrane receptor protein
VKHPFASFSICAIALAHAVAASAQDTRASSGATGDSGPIEDIVVTATRSATNLQETPLAITAVTAETLQERSITSTADLSSLVPNATFRQTQGAFGRSLSAFIRGIGQGDGSLAAEPGVAFYVDDSYYPLVLGSIFDLLDLDHIEVLRGPQGTLFGRNALAGAVNLVSKEPDPSESSGYAEVTTGEFNRIDARAGFNAPLGEALALRVSFVTKNRRGFQKRLDFRCEMIRRGTPELAGNFPFHDGLNIAPADNDPDSCVVGYNGGEKAYAARAALKWTGISDLAVSLIGDYSNDTSSVQADQLLAVNTATSNARPGIAVTANTFTAPGGPAFNYDSRFITGSPSYTYATYRDPIAAGANIPGTLFYNGSVTRGGLAFEPVNGVRNWGVTNKLVYSVTDDIDLALITGYRDLETTYTFDVDASPLQIEHTRNTTTHTQRTVELRASGKSALIDWTAGGFYYSADELVRLMFASPFANLQRYQNNRYEPESKSVFANVTLRPFGQKFGINLGGRYSDDEKPVSFNNRQDGVPSGDIVFQVTPAETRFDWKAGLNYELTDDSMLYASASTGFRLPSFNARPFQPSQVTPIPGDELVAYELGAKTDLFDRRLRLNSAVFYTDFRQRTTTVSGSEYQLIGGQQVPGAQVTEQLPGGPAGATRCRNRTATEIGGGVPGFACVPRTYYTNTPGEVKGVEAEFEARPFDGLSLNGAVGYARFDSPDLRAAGRANDRLVGIPETNANAGIQYELNVPFLGGSVTPRLDWFYTGSIAFSTTRNDLTQGGYSVFNGRITYLNEEHEFSVALSTTNLFDKSYYYNYFDYQALGFPNTNAQPSRPREWALTLGKKF